MTRPGYVGDTTDVPPPATARDYLAEMERLARVFLTGTDKPPQVIAAEVVATLREQDPELLTGWLELTAQDVVCGYLSGLQRADRARSRHGTAASAFGALVARHEGGDTGAFSTFEVRYRISSDGTRRRLGDMTGDDHRFVSGSLGSTAKTFAFLAAVHLAVADRVGDRRTEEVFNEQQYRAMFGDRDPLPDTIPV